MAKPRILLADDHTFLLQACQKMLEPDFEIPAVFTDGRALLKAAPALKPDAIVLDIGMPLLNGLDAARELKIVIPQAKLIFLTMYPDPDLAREAISAGASAYLLKTSAASELVKAIREALKGRVYVTPAIARAMQDSFIQNPETKHVSRELTARQREVLQLLAEGRPMKEAAYILKVSARTIAFHKYRMMEQLGFKSSAELIQFAVNQHLVAQRPELTLNRPLI
ncbi:MAG: two component transcriptional regulator, LuxR family [Acidobacteria bacterium]|nr:two component transcriptional regulator, LuxR family [Acidobacteriota bacterium]